MQTEARLTNPIEASLKSVEGLAQLQSSTYVGEAVVSLLLDTNIKIATASTEIRDNLNSVSLPDDTKLEVIPFNLNESSAVSYVAIGDKYDVQQLSQIASDKIVPAIARLSGVQRVEVLGNDRAKTELKIDHNASLVRFNRQNAIAVISRGSNGLGIR